MFSVTVNGNKAYKTELNVSNGKITGHVNGDAVSGDLLRISDAQFHLLHNGRSYNIEVLKISHAEKTMVLRVNTGKYTISLKDRYDELLHTLGLDSMAAKKVNEIKAPMPGMVLNILVKEGDTVKKGDALIVLEAMK